MRTSKVRLFLDHSLDKGQSVPLSRGQAHYLFVVMRKTAGDPVFVFNGRDGEWQADVTDAGRKDGTLVCRERSKPQTHPPDLWLLFAPVKKSRTDFIVEKAVEMGAARILPVQTDFTNTERVRRDRLQAHAVEAAEQCGETYVPEVAELQRLDLLLINWTDERNLMVCDESMAGESVEYPTKKGPWAILVGPEGGFSDAERSALAALKSTHAISLGPRILRADTAAVAALALWQQALGDW